MRFNATVTRSGSKTYIVIPFDPDAAWGVKERHHIAGAINGHAIRGALQSDGERHLLPLGAAWRRDNGVEAGADVEVELAAEGPQIDALAPDIVAALEAEPEARVFFDSLATFYRKNFLHWIEGAKRPETRSARIGEMVIALKQGKKER